MVGSSVQAVRLTSSIIYAERPEHDYADRSADQRVWAVKLHAKKRDFVVNHEILGTHRIVSSYGKVFELEDTESAPYCAGATDRCWQISRAMHGFN